MIAFRAGPANQTGRRGPRIGGLLLLITSTQQTPQPQHKHTIADASTSDVLQCSTTSQQHRFPCTSCILQCSTTSQQQQVLQWGLPPKHTTCSCTALHCSASTRCVVCHTRHSRQQGHCCSVVQQRHCCTRHASYSQSADAATMQQPTANIQHVQCSTHPKTFASPRAPPTTCRSVDHTTTTSGSCALRPQTNSALHTHNKLRW
jgi:hypothetical protein